jgi:hypothetical protein
VEINKDEASLLFLALAEVNVWIRTNSLFKEGAVWEARRKANLRLMAKIAEGRPLMGESPSYDQVAPEFKPYRPSPHELEKARVRLLELRHQLQAVADDLEEAHEMAVKEPLAESVRSLTEALACLNKVVLVSLGRASDSTTQMDMGIWSETNAVNASLSAMVTAAPISQETTDGGA